MNFNIDDKVSVLDDDFSGVIKHIFNDVVTIETEDGFLLEFSKEQLIKIGDQDDLISDQFMHGHVPEEEDGPRRVIPKKKSKNKKEKPAVEIDLHIEKLLPSSRGMDKHDILTYQLETARRQIEFAIQKRIQRIVFIHGQGEGILKLELEYLIGRYRNVSFEDANYQKYGSGATEVYFQQNAGRH